MSEDWIKSYAAKRRAKWDATLAENQRLASETAKWAAHYADFWGKLVESINFAVDQYNKSVGVRDLHIQTSHDQTDIHLSPVTSANPVMKVVVDQVAECLMIRCEGGNGCRAVGLEYPLELGAGGLFLSFDGITIPEDSMARRILELFFERLG